MFNSYFKYEHPYKNVDITCEIIFVKNTLTFVREYL